MFPMRSRPLVQKSRFTLPRIHHSPYSSRRSTPPTWHSALRAIPKYAAFGVLTVLSYSFVREKWDGRKTLGVGTGARTVASGEGFYRGSLEWKGKAVKVFTLKDVGEWLRKEEGVFKGPTGSGVESWYSIRCASNSPCEDSYVAAQTPVSGSKEKPWLFWGVFDGHNGSAMSRTLQETLVPYVARQLAVVFQGNNTPSSNDIDAAIISSFCKLDDEVISDGATALQDAKTLTEALSRLALGYAGSCALLSVYDPNLKKLRIACTGDCRAVLGSRAARSNSYTATGLSLDQTGFNKLELGRVQSEHPDEPEVIDIKTGRVLGLAVSRAFGDGLWKWPVDVLLECKSKFFWKSPRPGYKTPPYLTAAPVITTTQIREEGEFLILASDGLWDNLTSEQAVKLVEMWMIAKKEGTIGKVTRKEPEGTVARKLYIWERMKDEDFLVEDDNVATHLVRNALGGRDSEKLCGHAGVQPPLSRMARDDITVQVIFFDDKI